MKRILMFPGADAIEETSLRESCLRLDFVKDEIIFAQKILDHHKIPLNILSFMESSDQSMEEKFHHLAVATVIVQVGLYRHYVRRHGKPDVILSCSLGDVARNVCLGSASYEVSLIGMYDFVKSVTQNNSGVSCHITAPQGMREEHLKLLKEFNLEISIFQTSQHFLLGGTLSQFKKWWALVSQDSDMRFKILYPFPLHTKLMHESRKAVAPAILNGPMKPWDDVKVYSAIENRWLTTQDELRIDMLENITSAVRWHQGVLQLKKELGDVQFINLGPAPTLMQFHSRIFASSQNSFDFFSSIFDLPTQPLRLHEVTV